MIHCIDCISTIVAYIENSLDVILRCSQYFSQLSDHNITEKDENSKSKIVTRIPNHSALMVVEFEWKLKLLQVAPTVCRRVLQLFVRDFHFNNINLFDLINNLLVYVYIFSILF